MLLNSHQVSRSFSWEPRPQGPALPLDGWVFVWLCLCLIRRKVRADNRSAGCITEWLIIALLLPRLITSFKTRLLVQSHHWANWGESKSEARTNQRRVEQLELSGIVIWQRRGDPLLNIFHSDAGNVQPCTSTTSKKSSKTFKLFFSYIAKHQRSAVHKGNQWGVRASLTHHEFGSEA